MGSDLGPQRYAGGRLTLYEPIGVGGMATVHLGTLRTEAGVRAVAVKRPHPRVAADASFVAMLIDEARLLLRIRHPNVVQTHEVLVEPSEVLLVMDYAHGESLAAVLSAPSVAAEGVPLPIASAILADIADGLSAAHETRDDDGELLGIVHRDVSPHNVLVGADGVSRVLDFGIAKAAGRLQETKTGQLKGKIRYTAPEAFSGKELDHRADVYALAAVFWELLTGSMLVAAEGDGAAVRQILSATAPAPSSVRPSLPPALDAVVARGLARSPEHRHPSARAFAEAVLAIVPRARGEEVAAWLERHLGAKLAARLAIVREVERRATAEVNVDRRAAPSASRPWLTALVATMTVLVAGTAVFLVTTTPTGAATATRPETPPPHPAPAERPAPLVPSAVPPPDEPRTESAAPSAAPATLAKALPSQRRPAKAAPPPAPKRVDANCDPPWTLDSRGFRQFKPECAGGR